MAKALTARAVEATKPTEVRKEIPDGGLSGLYLVVQPTGKKSWALRYRFENKPRKMTLGRCGVLNLAAARDAARVALGVLDGGIDPADHKRRVRADTSVRTLLLQYEAKKLSQLKSGAEYKRNLDRFLLPALGDTSVLEIKKRDVLDVLDEIDAPVLANRVLAYMSAFFSWCVDRDIIDISPAYGIKKPNKETSRDRFLSQTEIATFWQACTNIGYPWGAYGKLLLLSGQRKIEVAHMKAMELDGSTWSMTGARTKNRRDHIVPLPQAALDIIQDRPEYLFSTNGTTPIQGFSKGLNFIHKEMERLDGKPVDHFTFHDLRRTASTHMNRLGVSVPVVEAILNHVSGSRAGVAGRYNQHAYEQEKREALQLWLDEVIRLSA